MRIFVFSNHWNLKSDHNRQYSAQLSLSEFSCIAINGKVHGGAESFNGASALKP